MPAVVPEQRLSGAARVPFERFWVLDTAASMAEGPKFKIAERVRRGDGSSEGTAAGIVTPVKVNGFTLLELLIAVGLLALLILTLAMLFSNGLKALRVGYNRAEMYANARTALDQMIREIPTAIADGSVNYPFVCYAPGTPGHFRGVQSVGPELYFVGQVSGAGKADVVELGYWLRDGTPKELWRFYVTDQDAGAFELYSPGALKADFSTPSGANNSALIAENMRDLVFVFHYRDSAGWKFATTWDSTQNLVANVDGDGNLKNPDGLPNAVEVRITVQDRLSKEKPQTLSAYIPLET